MLPRAVGVKVFRDIDKLDCSVRSYESASDTVIGRYLPARTDNSSILVMRDDANGQNEKNNRGDRNEYLPTSHGIYLNVQKPGGGLALKR